MKTATRILPVSLLSLLLASSPALPAATRTANSHRNVGSHNVASSSRHRPSSSKRARRARVSARRPNAYQRLARMQMDPSRVESIQKALSDAGAYHGTPTGQWDSSTRDAMARYQEQNGFAVTGLPDAKSLMKLGLGPHPLPAELDKTRATNLQLNAAAPGSGRSGTSTDVHGSSALDAAEPAPQTPPEP